MRSLRLRRPPNKESDLETAASDEARTEAEATGVSLGLLDKMESRFTVIRCTVPVLLGLL